MKGNVMPLVGINPSVEARLMKACCRDARMKVNGGTNELLYVNFNPDFR